MNNWLRTPFVTQLSYLCYKYNIHLVLTFISSNIHCLKVRVNYYKKYVLIFIQINCFTFFYEWIQRLLNNTQMSYMFVPTLSPCSCEGYIDMIWRVIWFVFKIWLKWIAIICVVFVTTMDWNYNWISKQGFKDYLIENEFTWLCFLCYSLMSIIITFAFSSIIISLHECPLKWNLIIKILYV